jgi:NAD(P)H dehydrogenase (quinone)
MIVVTGASRKLGGHVIKSLLEKVPAGQIIAAARNTEKALSLAELGVQPPLSSRRSNRLCKCQ